MHILFLTENFPPETNAAAARVFERACYWVRWGHAVTVVTCAPNFPHGRLYPGYQNRWHQTEMLSGIKVVRVKSYMAPNEGVLRRTADFVSYMVTAFLAGLFEKNPDVIIATSPQFFAAVAGWALGATKRRPFIFELGDLWPASIVAVGAIRPGKVIRMLERLELFLYRRSAAVVALSSSFKTNLIQRGIDAQKISVVINGVDLPRYKPQPRDKEFEAIWGLSGKFVIGYIGTLGMAHGLKNVLHAAERLKGRPDIRFLLVGPGAERDKLTTAITELGLNNVTIGSPQSKEVMPRVWSVCNVALVHLKNEPTFAEVIPSKMFEAMAMGLPILVAAPAGEATRLAEARNVGVCVPSDQPDALADAAIRLCDDVRLRRALAENALAAAPLHSRETQARDMLAVLDSVGRHSP